ncbi:hypothetical protein MBLNU230_g1602t1 [Neophaeotheca triangularis]
MRFLGALALLSLATSSNAQFDFIDDINSAVDDTRDAASSAIGGAVSTVRDGVEGAASTVVDGVQGAASTAIDGVEGAVSTAEAAASSAAESGQEAVSSVVSDASDAAGTVAVGANDVLSSMTDAINDATDEATDEADTLANRIANLIASMSRYNDTTAGVCSEISNQISDDSEVVYPLAFWQYTQRLKHYMPSSTQRSSCVVEVGSNEDAAITMKLIGDSRTPFAIKSGGHASNQGFSSTEGILITLNRLDHVDINDDRTSVTVGMGNLWSDAYEKMNGTGLQLNGGRVQGPGTGGFTLGGGYSWFTNQYGLTVDTVQSFTLVTPTGNLTQVNETTPDLFFALKGGLNRFGLVTETVFTPFEQDYEVYGGYQIYASDDVPAIINATQKFYDDEVDEKAQVILTLNTGFPESAILLVFYDGPSPPDEVFAPFASIQPILNGVQRQPYASFASSTPSNLQAGRRGAFHTLTTTALTIPFMQACWSEAQDYRLFNASGIFFSYDIEPFGKDYGRHATNSSYPHALSGLPLNLYFAWLDAGDDDYWRDEIRASVDRLIAVAKDEGIYVEGNAYPNYAIGSYTAEQVYGEENAERLRRIRGVVDPENVMGLTGGFDF